VIPVSGLVARYLGRDGAFATTPVVAMRNEHEVFVCYDGDLLQAHLLPGFSGIHPVTRYVLLPGDRWTVKYGVPGETTGRRTPVLAWQIDPATGHGQPLIADKNGEVAPLHSRDDLVVFEVRHAAEDSRLPITSERQRLLRDAHEMRETE
jgi:hypothetical protein